MTHTSPGSDRGQVVNISDCRGPGPIEPIDRSAPLRHGDYHCSTATARRQGSRASRSLSVRHVPATPLICFGLGRVSAAGSNVCSTGAHWRRRSKQGRAVLGAEREEVSISAVPAATHLPLPVTSYYCDTNTTCAVEYDLHKRDGGGFHFQFYSRNRRLAGNYMQMKTVSIKHDPCVCVSV